MWQHAVVCVLSRCYISFSGSICCCDIIQLNIVFGLNIWCFNVSERWQVSSGGRSLWTGETLWPSQLIWVRGRNRHVGSASQLEMVASLLWEVTTVTFLRAQHRQVSARVAWLQSDSINTSSQEQHSNTDTFIDTCYSVKSGGSVYISHILSLKQLKSHTYKSSSRCGRTNIATGQSVPWAPKHYPLCMLLSSF